MPINYQGRLESAVAVQSVWDGAYEIQTYTAGPSYDPTETDPSVYTRFTSWDEGSSQPVALAAPTTPADTVPIAASPLTFTVATGASLPATIIGVLLVNISSGLLVGVFPFGTSQVMSVVGQTLTLNEHYDIGPIAP